MSRRRAVAYAAAGLVTAVIGVLTVIGAVGEASDPDRFPWVVKA